MDLKGSANLSSEFEAKLQQLEETQITAKQNKKLKKKDVSPTHTEEKAEQVSAIHFVT